VIHTALWGRRRIDAEDSSGVRGIGRLFVGHTPQWHGLKRFGNVYAVDTGAVFGEIYSDGGHLTVLNIALATAGAVERREVGSLDLRDGAAPPRPFGAYAK
jgi:serine/threonine protein phosphatase 1